MYNKLKKENEKKIILKTVNFFKQNQDYKYTKMFNQNFCLKIKYQHIIWNGHII